MNTISPRDQISLKLHDVTKDIRDMRENLPGGHGEDELAQLWEGVIKSLSVVAVIADESLVRHVAAQVSVIESACKTSGVGFVDIDKAKVN